ncbi:MAG: GNAT family N-acetyltransferase [Pseudomonadota bacterium]
MMVTIRPLRASDEQAWRRLWRGYLAFYEASVDDAVYTLTLARLLDDEVPEMGALVAEREGAPVGLVHYIFHRHCWRVEDVCYLQDLYVTETARGTGAGRALVEAVYAEADRRGSPAVYWLTQDFNATARQLYDRIATQTPFIKYQR